MKPPLAITRSKAAWRAGGLLAVAIVAVVNVVLSARKILPPPMASPVAAVDPVTRQERRFAGLRQALRAREVSGIIGYLGDSPGQELLADSRQVEDFYLAQFVLVPVVLDRDPAPHEWAVANLRTKKAVDRVGPDWRVVANFGEGVLLLRKAAR